MIGGISRRGVGLIGLDIGRGAVRAVQLGRRGGLAGALEVGLAEESEGALREGLGRMVARGEFAGREVVLHCPAERLDLRGVELPAARELPREAVLGALRLQLGGQLPFDMKEAVFDYFSTGQGGGRRSRVIAVTADGRWIRERLGLVESVGLSCVAVEAFPCAIVRLLECEGKSGEDEAGQDDEEGGEENVLTAVLDVGYSGSTLVVQGKDGPVFCRRFQLGGQELTRMIAQRLGVDEWLAERLKRRFGIDSHTRRLRQAVGETAGGGRYFEVELEEEEALDVEQDAEIAKTIYAAVGAGLSDYVEGLVRSLNYVITHESSCRLERMVLCGGGAELGNLESYLTEQFEIPVVRWSGSVQEEIMAGQPGTRACAGSWTTAIALAWAGRRRG